MTDKELITITIDRYAELQRIKQANGSQENHDFLQRLLILHHFSGLNWFLIRLYALYALDE